LLPSGSVALRILVQLGLLLAHEPLEPFGYDLGLRVR
jgi:hypothetical protein